MLVKASGKEEILGFNGTSQENYAGQSPRTMSKGCYKLSGVENVREWLLLMARCARYVCYLTLSLAVCHSKGLPLRVLSGSLGDRISVIHDGVNDKAVHRPDKLRKLHGRSDKLRDQK